jgi:Sulfate permease and related transporters (MFS superfamily)
MTQNRLFELFLPNPISKATLRGDIFGGLTTGVVAIPLALAFGVATGMEEGAQAGLFSAILLGFMAALFGGTAPQVSGPTGPMTVVATAFLATGAQPAHLFLAVVLGGLIQIGFGLLGFGHYIRYVPRTVVSGFMSGIGVIILLLQIQPILGDKAAPAPLKALAGFTDSLARVNMTALLLGLSTIALIYLFPRITKAVPSTLVALIIMTAVSQILGLNVPIIGDLPSGLPQLQVSIPSAEALSHIFLAALTLAILGSLDSLLGSVVVDNVTGTKHQSNKELVGQGMGNMLSGAFGGLPGAGATMRTLLNIRSGGKTALSGIIHSFLLLGVLLGLSRFASQIPLAVLAGILVTVGISIIDYQGLRLLKHSPKSDRIVLLLVLGLTVFVDLITAVQMGFLVACLLFLKNLSDREITNSGSLAPMVQDDLPEAQALAEKVRVIQAEGPVFFGTSEAFILSLEDDLSNVRAIIIRMSRVPLIDQTGAFTLQEFVKNMEAKGIAVVLSGLPSDPEQVLRNLDIIPTTIPESSVQPSLAEAVIALSERIAANASEALRPKHYLHKVGG